MIIDALWRQSKYRMAAVGRSVAVEEWLAEFDTGFVAVAGRFGRVEPWRQARCFLLGLLSDVDTRLCWQLAECRTCRIAPNGNALDVSLRQHVATG
jgi:hypothetical protein